MARELRLVQDDILRKVTIGSFATNVVQLGITLMTIAQASAPAPHPQNRSEKDKTKLSTGCGVPSDHLSGLRKFNLSELEVATQNFSVEKLIGRGGYGAVFKGVLRNGQVVAIKDMRISVVNGGDEVLHNEIKIGRKLQHRNVVKTLGYCIDDQMVSVWHEGQEVEAVKQRRLLVNGYLPNGSLNRTILQGTQGICWPFCFRILQGIAQGLHYLHEQNILHLDPKPENIIFDSDMNPVIIDFGLSVVLDNEDDIVTLEPVGTLGYMAPEYINNGVVSKKQDVFAFGVVLLQTIFRGCAKVDFQDYYYRDADSKWDGVLQQDVDKIKEIFDPTLVEESELADVARCLMVGLLCREFDPADRPTMAEVLDMLNGEKEVPAPKDKPI
ncbi:protein NSP-INTERACTING KINASE 3 [Sorghum bicolor]|uniref:Protein kinase domain-containing protein n=1 Tax=Sorghum bicolor TaxID=4558 RepID=C5Y7H4_SORBI|nr:protein NSP-INTERACTING KINASE 3 [Sorghum bicolor]EES10219.2 hypothetical protein SORBI_3005G208100 [Sorghum bicolor]|eukprot:XP_021317478.1 protein NSP-INTERACTING KINASE 3 [Sorghum bicolor]